MKRLVLVLPLAIFLGVALFLYRGLYLNTTELPSALIGKPFPAFALPSLDDPARTLTQDDLKGKPAMVNVWATWCPSCRAEHPVLMDFAKAGVVPVIGLNYKDGRIDGIKWLQDFGNPYATSAFDNDGRVGIDYGVYGVPETFVIDKKGVIRMKYTGPLTPDAITTKLMPLIKELKSA